MCGRFTAPVTFQLKPTAVSVSVQQYVREFYSICNKSADYDSSICVQSAVFVSVQQSVLMSIQQYMLKFYGICNDPLETGSHSTASVSVQQYTCQFSSMYGNNEHI